MADNKNTQKQDNASLPLKPDGTPYTIEEIRQIQAYRRAMAAKRANAAAQQNGNSHSGKDERTMQQTRSVQSTASQRRPAVSYRRRKAEKPNPALLCFILLAVIISVFGIVQIVRNQSAVQQEETGQTEHLPVDIMDSLESDSDTVESDAVPETEMLWNTVTVGAEQLYRGDLILVNYNYAYPEADTIAVKTVYGNKSTTYQVSNTNIALTDKALNAMNAMADAFYADTNCGEMIIVSGYRNVEDQRRIYNDRVASQGEEMAALYVATPSYSEHHTGLAMDLSFYTADGASVAVEDHEFGAWINEHCAEYGYVLRYPSNKVDITKIGYESWHYRYVGIPHAAIMTERNLCLEEYIDELKQYTPDTQFLWVQSNGSVAAVSPDASPKEGYLIYYVAQTGEETEIRIPRGNLFADYEISGNNTDGFIVTVHIGA